MNLFQKMLKKITFGAYDPEKKFEQEVLGEGKTNLEEIESLRNDVSKAVAEYDKYFPNNNISLWNNYESYDVFSNGFDYNTLELVDKNKTASDLVKAEEQLQKQGKYIGMDEATRIKAVLSEGRAASEMQYARTCCSLSAESIDEDVLNAMGISVYEHSMKDEPWNSFCGRPFRCSESQ